MSVKVVVRRFVDPYVVEVSAQQTFGGYGQQDLLVDFGRIVLRTTDVVVALTRINEYPFRAAYAATVGFQRDFVCSAMMRSTRCCLTASGTSSRSSRAE